MDECKPLPHGTWTGVPGQVVFPPPPGGGRWRVTSVAAGGRHTLATAAAVGPAEVEAERKGAAHQPGSPQSIKHSVSLGRGLRSFTLRLNASTFCGIRGAFRGCLGGVWEVSGVIGGRLGCILCKKGFRLS